MRKGSISADMDLFATLEKKQRTTHFQMSDELAYYLENNGILVDYPIFSCYRKAESPFQVARANIVLRSFQAKQTIDDGVKTARLKSFNLDEKGTERVFKETMTPILDKLPYHVHEGEKIYIPFFSKSINRLYAGEWTKLVSSPYKRFLKNFDSIFIDPFDYYGDDLFESLFTKFVRAKKTEEGSAFYDYDSFTIFFVNKQGRLDCQCCLFDRYLKDHNRNHMMERIQPVIDAYYNGNLDDFKRYLVENKLISSRLISKINSDEASVFKRIERDCAEK